MKQFHTVNDSLDLIEYKLEHLYEKYNVSEKDKLEIMVVFLTIVKDRQVRNNKVFADISLPNGRKYELKKLFLK